MTTVCTFHVADPMVMTTVCTFHVAGPMVMTTVWSYYWTYSGTALWTSRMARAGLCFRFD